MVLKNKYIIQLLLDNILAFQHQCEFMNLMLSRARKDNEFQSYLSQVVFKQNNFLILGLPPSNRMSSPGSTSMPNARLCRNGLQNGGLHLSGTKFPGNTETGIDGSLPKKKKWFF